MVRAYLNILLGIFPDEKNYKKIYKNSHKKNPEPVAVRRLSSNGCHRFVRPQGNIVSPRGKNQQRKPREAYKKV